MGADRIAIVGLNIRAAGSSFKALARGLMYFARARTVGTEPAFIRALADLCLDAAHARGWA